MPMNEREMLRKRIEELEHTIEVLQRERLDFGRFVLDHLPIHIFLKDRQGRFTYVNEQTAQFIGKPKEEIIGKQVNELFDHAVTAKAPIYDERAFEINQQETYEDQYTIHGKTLDFYVSKNVIALPHSDEQLLLGYSLEITNWLQKEEALRESEDRYRCLVELSPDAILVYSEGKIMFANNTLLRLVGADSPERVIGRSLTDFIPREQLEELAECAKRNEGDNDAFSNCEGQFIRLDGEVIDVEASANSITFHGKPARLTIVREITERKIAEQKLRDANRLLLSLSNRDGLTGIANRRFFDETFEKEWNRCARVAKPISLIMLDIDYFKLYNDTYGHLAGDQCLQTVSAQLEKALKRSGDIVVRYGGEEFAIILPESPLEGAKTVAERARKLVEALEMPHHHSKVSENITISLGIATIIPNKLMDRKVLIMGADKALYKAKEEGRNRFEVFVFE